jgi:uncharacterized protein YggE
MKALIAPLVALLFAGFASANVTVTGSGKVTYVPDLLHLVAGVSSDGKTATAAWQKNEAAVKKMFEALKALGIDPKDVKTSGLNLSPRYVHHTGQEPELVGYTASYDLSVTVRQLANAGRVLDALVENGANRQMNIAFGSSELDKLTDEARTKAVVEARKKAQLYVTTAGASLGDVISISEGQSPVPQYLPYERAMKADAGLPIAAGQQELSVDITLVYGIKHAPQS